MIEDIDPMTGMPVQKNRGGMPSRSINDLQQINTIQDPGMQSAQQAAAFQKFNNIAQYNPPPAIMKSPAKKYTEPAMILDKSSNAIGAAISGEAKTEEQKQKEIEEKEK